MESEVTFELFNGLFWISVVVCIVGLAVMAAVFRFGLHIFFRISRYYLQEVEYYLDNLMNGNQPRTNEIKALSDSIADFRERRNEFWSIYGQILLSVFIMIVLTILLITRTITAEAGLPILSAITGFAIAKGVNSSKRGTLTSEG